MPRNGKKKQNYYNKGHGKKRIITTVSELYIEEYHKYRSDVDKITFEKKVGEVYRENDGKIVVINKDINEDIDEKGMIIDANFEIQSKLEICGKCGIDITNVF